MTKKEKYDQKIEIIKKFLESDGSVEELIRLQNDSTLSDNVVKVQQETTGNENSNKCKFK